jgi:hypothetical protein
VTNLTSTSNSSKPSSSIAATPSPAVRQTAGAWAARSVTSRGIVALIITTVALGFGMILLEDLEA